MKLREATVKKTARIIKVHCTFSVEEATGEDLISPDDYHDVDSFLAALEWKHAGILSNPIGRLFENYVRSSWTAIQTSKEQVMKKQTNSDQIAYKGVSEQFQTGQQTDAVETKPESQQKAQKAAAKRKAVRPIVKRT